MEVTRHVTGAALAAWSRQHPHAHPRVLGQQDLIHAPLFDADAAGPLAVVAQFHVATTVGLQGLLKDVGRIGGRFGSHAGQHSSPPRPSSGHSRRG